MNASTTSSSIAALGSLLATVLALSACGGGGSSTPPTPPLNDYQINSSNLLDVFVVAAKNRDEAMSIERIWQIAAVQLLTGDVGTGKHTCPGGGTFDYQGNASESTLNFDKCTVGDSQYVSGTLGYKSYAGNSMDFDTKATALQVSGAGTLGNASYSGNISQRSTGSNSYTISGSYSSTVKGKTETISLNSSYEISGLSTTLKRSELSIASPRLAGALKLSGQSQAPAELSASSADGSTVISTTNANGVELSLFNSIGGKASLTRQVSAAELLEALQRLY
ncbi:hypothetical protein RQP53_12875 [Paucibacter sp. APW11]|uniref:Lipoprotein n=1 Tax=Roseateles aquae TaxID=3077235 RepID=A0ABU3PDH0_9BURK|nr:hypothetical protein [Paucibacter sp. APW11]MDT9000163.1 hypothetical protein [Paucibacter sp. APW11]